ncbi:MGMT family protein [Enterococcus faecalis]|uniref:MGMT family protein n=1 Tax=Enterococcus faecalis TaxID=1351 RepID=A0A974NYR1_ENTFL|nr:MGMT family protein [Enterococcus faecalis]
MQEIPYGETITYQEISEKNWASTCGSSSWHSDWEKNPLLMVIPCHRVIGDKGQLTRLPWWFSNETSIINI